MAMLRLLSLLGTRLPEIEYRERVGATATATACECGVDPPAGYHPWVDFSEQVMEHLAATQDSDAPRFSQPIPFPGKISSERGVRALLYAYWTNPIAQMGAEMHARGSILGRPGFGSPDCVKEVLGCPDYVMFDEEGDLGCTALVVAKPRWLLHPQLSAAGICSSSDAARWLRQLYGYINLNMLYGTGRGYGVLTNFESTWFCKLAGESMLVSNPIRASSSTPGILASLWYFMHLVFSRNDDGELVPFVHEQGNPLRDPATRLACSLGLAIPEEYLGVLNYQDLTIGECIYVGENCVVYRADYADAPVVIKCLDISQHGMEFLGDYLREIDAYIRLLQSVQRISTPRLLAAGFFHVCMLFVLVLSDEGESMEALRPSQRVKFSEVAEQGLQSLHSLGLVHGNICLSNVCVGATVNKSGDRELTVRWVDFSSTRPGTPGEMQAEIDVLHSLFSLSYY